MVEGKQRGGGAAAQTKVDAYLALRVGRPTARAALDLVDVIVHG